MLIGLRLALVSLVVAPLVAVSTGPAVGEPVVPAAAPAPAKTPKVLLVGLDGAAFARFGRAHLPVLDQLRRKGLTATSNLYAQPMAPTVSGPGWSTILTGVWPDKHGVHDNYFRGRHYDRYPDVLTRVERARPGLVTAGLSIWDPITEIVLSRAVDRRIDSRTDTQTTAEAVSLLRDGDPDATFVHLCQADHAGHAHGADSRAYAQALEQVDHRIGRLLAAVRQRPTYDDESWLVLVTADHGMRPAGGHGGATPLERGTFVIADGPGIARGSTSDAVKAVDLAPTILDHLGVPVLKRWHLDGQPLRTIEPDAFDGLRRSLRGGTTHRVPTGWTRLDQRMPGGGAAAWRGWTLTTDDRWSNAAGGRVTNVHSRDVFAVADAGLWRGRGFDATLATAPYDVTGRRRAAISFVSDLQPSGGVARVQVRFGTGPVRTVGTYGRATNGVQRLLVAVPDGAERMSVRFRFAGGGYWAIDQVGVR